MDCIPMGLLPLMLACLKTEQLRRGNPAATALFEPLSFTCSKDAKSSDTENPNPGHANLPIGIYTPANQEIGQLKSSRANQEIGVPRGITHPAAPKPNQMLQSPATAFAGAADFNYTHIRTPPNAVGGL